MNNQILRQIIVIEDNKVISKQLEMIFESQGLDVTIFNSAEEFLYAEENHLFSLRLFLIDLNLPGLQGQQIVEFIRYRDKISPIFMISAESLSDKIVNCFKAGADDFIMKPFDPEVLLLKVQNALKKHSTLNEDKMALHLTHETRAFSFEGRSIKLSPREYQVLEILLSDMEHIHETKEFILKMDCGNIVTNVIPIYISSLRKKLKVMNLHIHTCRGKGYKITRRNHSEQKRTV